MKHYITYNATENDEGREVLEILKGHFLFSSRKIRSVKFADDGLLLNGARVTVRRKLENGDCLKVLLDDSDKRKSDVYPVSMELDIVYEDDYFLVLNKPAGIVCHPSKWHYFDSLENGVVFYLENKSESPLVHLCGRLDKDTSGLVIFAKNGTAEYALKNNNTLAVDAFVPTDGPSAQQTGFDKTYYAICSGTIKEDQLFLNASMREERGTDGLLKMMADPLGMNAQTTVTVLKRGQGLTFVKVKIATGRMHQIRFHLSNAGYPLLGDKLYGSGSEMISRAALHAGEICFIHPFTGESIELHADIPEDMMNIIKTISS